MLSKSFFGSSRPVFHYELLSKKALSTLNMPAPQMITLLLPMEQPSQPSETIRVGATVKSGQKLQWFDQSSPCIVSSITGTIREISGQLGDYGQKHTAITIERTGEELWDDRFTEASNQPSLQTAIDFLSSAPGGAPLIKLSDKSKSIHTVAVYGGDTDLLVETNIHALKNRIEEVNEGIKILKEITGIERFVIAVPGESIQNVDGHFLADIKNVPGGYPSGQPLMLCYELLGHLPQQGQSFEDLGLFLIRAEAVASIGKAFTTGIVPVDKTVTVLDKSGRKNLIKARIGTPVGNILQTLGVTLNEGDRIIIGGPMTGRSIYSEEQPVTPDTDAIMVQDRNNIILSSDYPCINCGECTRTCPAKIQVHMLERFLEAGQYQEGADLYDLYSCVECGLCSFVCVSRIPILQYIKLAKYELGQAIPAEEVAEEVNE